MNIYQIDQRIEEIYNSAIDMETGEISEDAIAQLETLEMARSEKIENIALWRKNVVSDTKAIADEIKALQERKKALEKKIAWQERYLSDALAGKTFETPRVSISYRKSTSVQIDDEDKFVADHMGDGYCTSHIEWKIDKNEIKKRIKNGEEILGAELVEKMNMQIK